MSIIFKTLLQLGIDNWLKNQTGIIRFNLILILHALISFLRDPNKKKVYKIVVKAMIEFFYRTI